MTLERAAPPRGTRPRNRRALIIAAATELFQDHGYDQVSMSDVAAAVNVAPSALYRHFAGKPQLFTAALVAEMTPIRELLGRVADAELIAVAEQLATAALDHTRLGRLWQREARSLPRDDYDQLRLEVTASVAMLADLIAARRPELSRADTRMLAVATYSVLCSVSYHPDELPRGQYEQLLSEVILLILQTGPTPPAPSAPSAEREPPLLPVARRERLLRAATALFAERGYSAVSMEEIGAAAGIAGGSVYYHFDSKQQLLAAALTRGDEWLRYDMYRALRGVTDPGEGLRRLLRSYIEFAMDHSTSLDLLVSEARHLAEEVRSLIKQTQRDYLGEWIQLIRSGCPAMSEAEAKVRVHAVLTIVNDAARTPWLRSRPGVLATLNEVGNATLQPPAPTPTPHPPPRRS